MLERIAKLITNNPEIFQNAFLMRSDNFYAYFINRINNAIDNY